MDKRIIKHKFSTHEINRDTEILIVGTFNPDTAGNDADFFYSRKHNFLWEILPEIFPKGTGTLKGKSVKEKLTFMHINHINFIDLISEVEVELGQENNYNDKYLDSKVKVWYNIIDEIKKLKKIRMVCITRSTLTDIPNMKGKVDEIKKHCEENNIQFHFLLSPSSGSSISISLAEEYKNYRKNNPNGNTITYRKTKYKELLNP